MLKVQNEGVMVRLGGGGHFKGRGDRNELSLQLPENWLQIVKKCMHVSLKASTNIPEKLNFGPKQPILWF